MKRRSNQASKFQGRSRVVKPRRVPARPSNVTPYIAFSNLALLYKTEGQYALARPLLKGALAIHEKILGPEHPDTATSLNNLAGLYHAEGQYARARPLFERALTIKEKVLGPEHPDTLSAKDETYNPDHISVSKQHYSQSLQ